MKAKICVAVILFAGMIGIASADQCHAPVRTGHVQTAQTVHAVQAVHAPAVITTAAVLPIYGAAYQQAATGDDDETKALLRQLLEEMRAMRADLNKVPPQALGVAAGPDPAAILKKSCASCHTGDKAKGGFLIYTDKGESVKLSPADRREMTKRVASGNMPPPPVKLSVAEKDAVAKGLK